MQSVNSRLLKSPWLRAVLYTAIWAALWFAPWGMIAPGLPWVRLAIGMVLFSAPGALTYDQLKGESSEAVELVVAGFAVSIGITSIVGLIALIVHLPFWVVPVSLFVAGALQWVRVAFRGAQGVGRFVDDNRIIVFVGVVVAVLQIGLLTYVVTDSRAFSGDDYKYGAYLIKWQTSSSLSFENALFNNGQIAPVRYRAMLFPMSQAVISDLSDIPDLVLIQVYIEAALGILCLLSVYVLARLLGLSSLQAGLAVMFQGLVFLMLSSANQAGRIFINRVAHDKTIVAFLLGPVVIAIIRLYLMKPSVQRWLLLLLVGVGAGLSHPTMAAVVVMIAGLYSLIELVRAWDKTRFALIVLALALSILWPAVLRFTEPDPVHPFSVEGLDETTELGQTRARRIIVVGEEFVGFTPQTVEVNGPVRQYKSLMSRLDLQDAPVVKAVLDGVGMVIPYIWLALAAITFIAALTRVRDDHAARYIVAASVVFLLALVPYTGWIIGKIITPWHLWRVPWHYPFGIGLAFLFGVIGDVLHRRSQPSVYKAALVLFVVATLALNLLLYTGLFRALRMPHPSEEGVYIRLQEIGEQLDRNIAGESAIVVGTPQVNRFLPSISARAELIWHRRLEDMLITGMPSDVALQQRDDYRTLAEKGATEEARLRIIEKYHVKFIVIEDAPGWAARLLDNYPDRVRAVYEGENVIILSVIDPSPGS